MNARPPPLCHLTFRCASHSCIVADLLGGKPLSSLYCVRHAGLGPKRDTAKHASTQHRERVSRKKTWRRLMGTGRGRVNRDEWQARQRLCKTNRNGWPATQPNTDLLANTGSACLAKHQQGEWQNFHSEQSSNSPWAVGGGPRQGPAWAKEGEGQRNGPQPQSRQPRVQWQTLAHACRWIPSSALSPSSRPLCLLVQSRLRLHNAGA